MGSGISCHREAAVPVSSPKTIAGKRSIAAATAGATDGAAPNTASTAPACRATESQTPGAGSRKAAPRPGSGSQQTASAVPTSAPIDGEMGPRAATSRPASAATASTKAHDVASGTAAAGTGSLSTLGAAAGASAAPDVAAAPAPPASGRRLNHIGGLAVSLAFLIDFAERHVTPSLPTWAVVDTLIKPHTLQPTIRYVDLPHVFRHTLPPGRTDYYFVSHAWGRPFWEMVGLCAHYLRGAVPEDTFVWCDIFIINQHPGQQQADDLQQLRLAVRDAAATLVCTDAAGAPFERIWCLFEMWTTLKVVAAAGVASEEEAAARRTNEAGGGRGGGGDGGAVRSRSQALVVLTTGLSATQRARLYSLIDASTATATVPTDKDRILADIAASPGGVTAFNAAMRCALLLRPLDYEGELAAGLAPAEPAAPAAVATRGSAPGDREAQPHAWDFGLLDSWLALQPGARHHRALALLGGPGTGKSSAAAAAMSRLLAAAAPGGAGRRAAAQGGGGGGGGGGGAPAGGGGGDGGMPVAAHFCRASNLQALDPLAALRTIAYQLSLLFPEQLQSYFAFDLAKSRGRGDGRGGSDSGDGDIGSSFALQAIAGLASAEGGGGGGGDGGGGGGGGGDPVAAAFEALLLRPLELLWKSYEEAVQLPAASCDDAADGTGCITETSCASKGTEAGVPPPALASQPASLPPPPPPPPRLVILLDAVDEGDSGGSQENAMLLLLQEQFPRLPAFVRLIVTARPLPHIRALLVHKFDPWVVTPEQLRPPAPACAAALAARLARRPALAPALQRGPTAGGGGGSGGFGAMAERLWQASKGWMLFLTLAEDVLEAAAAAAVAVHTSGQTAQTAQIALPAQLASVVAELEAAAAAAAAHSLYSLYMRVVVAPSVAAAAAGGKASRGGGDGDGGCPAAEDLAFLLEVLGAAREPLYLSQLKDLGLPAISSRESDGGGGGGGGAAAATAAGLRLGILVSVRGYKLHGIHRSLFEWLATGGADEVPRLLAAAGGVRSDASAGGAGGGRGLRRGHSALAAMALRDVAAARTSQSAAGGGGGGGGARGPRGPDSYSLQHAAAHVLEAAAAKTAAGDEEGALALLRALLLDFYYWRCVYLDGSAAAVALAALLRHEAIFAAAAAAAPTTAASSSGSGSGAAAALAADAARWLQSYHGSLLRFPEAILQSALALPAASPIRAAALAALAPPRSPRATPACRPTSALAAVPATSSPDSKPASRPASNSGAAPPPAMSRQTPPGKAVAAAAARPPSPPPAAQLEGVSWPKAVALSNPPDDWDACLMTVESRGVTRGVAWVPEPGLVVTACDDRKVHILSPVTGGQVGLMEGHTDRVYCLALRPETRPMTPPNKPLPMRGAAGAAEGAAVVVAASGSLDGRVVLWDVGSRMQLQVLQPGEKPATVDGGEAPDGGGGGSAAATTSFGYSVVEDRPSGPSAGGSVDCLAFSPDGAWLGAGNSDGSITVWRILEEGSGCDQKPSAAAAAALGAGDAAAATVRAVKAWTAPKAHRDAVAGLVFLQLEQPEQSAAGGNSCGRDGGGSGLPSLVLASCSEDGCVHLWDPRVADGGVGAGVVVVSDPLRTLRADSGVQGRFEAAGLEPQRGAATDPWFIRDVACCSSSQAGGGGGRGDASAPPLLAGVAEDVGAPHSRASYRAPEHHCLAAGPGLPPGCILAGSGSGPVAVWDASSGLVRERLRGHVDAVHCLALQNGGPHFASGSGDGTVRLWRHLPTADPEGWDAALQSARQRALDDAAAADAARAAAAAAATAEAEERRTTRKEVAGLCGADPDATLEQEEDAVAEEEKEEEQAPAVRVCHRPCQWQCVAVLRGHTRLVTSLTFLSSGGPAQLPALPACTGPRLKPMISRLVSSSVDFTVRIWRADPGAAAAAGGGGSGGAVGQRPVGHTGYSVNTVAVSADDRLIATGADDFEVCVWDGRSGQHRRTLRCFYGRVRAVAFSRDSRRMATASEDGAVLTFDIDGDNFSNIGSCRGHTKAATGVAFSPDGFSVASSSEDGTARIWAVRGFQTALLEGHPSGATAVAWAEEGSLVATGAAKGDPGVKLWDARRGMCINTLRYHMADVAILAFGSAVEQPPPPPAAPAPSAASRPSSAAGVAASEDPAPPPRRHVLLLSVDVRGLACVWDVWGGGLLHYIDHVQGADLTGSRLLWLQARAVHFADVQELLQRPPPGPEQDKEANDGSGGRRQSQRRCLTTALAALYPPGEAVEVVAAGRGLSCVAVVTDKQRLYIFRPCAGPLT